MNRVTVNVFKDPASPDPSHQLTNIPWFAGLTALQAMVIGEAMYEASFSFRVVYRSVFGAFIDSIDGLEDDPTTQHFWTLYINGVESNVGASEAIILEDETIDLAVIEWRFADFSAGPSKQVDLKTKSLPANS